MKKGFSQRDNRYWFMQWLNGMGSLYVTHEAKARRDIQLAGWLDNLGGLGSVW